MTANEAEDSSHNPAAAAGTKSKSTTGRRNITGNDRLIAGVLTCVLFAVVFALPFPFSSAPSSTTTTSTSQTPPLEGMLTALEERRSRYQLSDHNFPLTGDDVTALTRRIVALTPSSFNSQTTRAIVLTGPHHRKLWGQIVYEHLGGSRRTSKQQRQQQGNEKGDEEKEEEERPHLKRLHGFEAGFGTVLFFEDDDVITYHQRQFAHIVKDPHNFAVWASQSSGSAQIALWTALASINNESNGHEASTTSPAAARTITAATRPTTNARIGVNIQHSITPDIEAAIREEWGVPVAWRLTAELVIGTRVETEQLKPRSTRPVDETVRAFH